MQKHALVSHLNALPSGLTSLDLHHTEVVELPRLPASLRILHAAACRIRCFPEVGHCTQLESIDLSDNYIEDIQKSVPRSCRTLNLSFNKLKSINFDMLPAELVDLDVSSNYLTEVPVSWCTKTNFYNNSMKVSTQGLISPTGNIANVQRQRQHVVDVLDDGRQILDNFPIQRLRPVFQLPKQNLTYDDGQNVHLSSVQKSANHSLDAILKSAPRPNFVREIKKTYGPRWIFWRWRPPIDGWVTDKTVHSIHGTTYGELLEHVWSHICDHENKADLIKIMQDELWASWMMCYTGRFTRTVNILTGFIDGVVVKISDREELQNCMTVLMNSLTADNLEKTLKEAESQLEKYDITDAEKESWLTALKDSV